MANLDIDLRGRRVGDEERVELDHAQRLQVDSRNFGSGVADILVRVVLDGGGSNPEQEVS